MLITSQREMIFITLLAHQEKLPKLENFSKKEFWKILYVLGRALFLKVIFSATIMLVTSRCWRQNDDLGDIL